MQVQADETEQVPLFRGHQRKRRRSKRQRELKSPASN